MEELTGKVAVVTGGASGIGLAMGRAFAAEGMKVVLADIEGDALDKAGAEMPDGSEVELFRCDVSDPAQVDALRDAAVERFGTVHVVCNNAGVGSGGLMWEVDVADWEWVLGVNLMGVVHGIRSFTPLLIEQGEGHIVNTASMAGVTSPPFMGPYNASKHAVVTISETLYSDLQVTDNAGIGVTALCPGWVNTRIHESARNKPGAVPVAEGEEPGEDGLRDVVGGLISSGLDPDHVAGLVVDAVRAGQFYVLTHPEWIAGVSDRVERMLGGENPRTILPT